MKKIFTFLVLLLFLVPITGANLIDDDVKEKIDDIEIDSDTLSKVSWFLPVVIELKSTDSTADYFVELDEDQIQVLDETDDDPDIVIKATLKEFQDGFNSENKDVGAILTKFKFETNSFKGSVITIGLEKTYDKVLLDDPTTGQKFTRWLIGLFV